MAKATRPQIPSPTNAKTTTTPRATHESCIVPSCCYLTCCLIQGYTVHPTLFTGLTRRAVRAGYGSNFRPKSRAAYGRVDALQPCVDPRASIHTRTTCNPSAGPIPVRPRTPRATALATAGPFGSPIGVGRRTAKFNIVAGVKRCCRCTALGGDAPDPPRPFSGNRGKFRPGSSGGAI